MARGAPPVMPRKAPVCSLQNLRQSTQNALSDEINERNSKKMEGKSQRTKKSEIM